MSARRRSLLVISFLALAVAASAAQPTPEGPALPPRFRATVVQVAVGDPGAVRAQLRAALRAEAASELFVLPEFVCRGDGLDLDAIPYLREDPEARAVAQGWVDATPPWSDLRGLLSEASRAGVVGCLARDGDRLVSRLTFYDPIRGQEEHYDKTHVHWTEAMLRPGDALRPFDTRFGRMGLLLCYDMAFVEPTRVLGVEGADLLVVGSAIPAHFSWRYPRRRMIGAAIFNQYYVLSAVQARGPGFPMGGHSGIYDPRGEELALLKGDRPGHVSATLDLAEVERWREEERIRGFRRPDLYGPLTRPER